MFKGACISFWGNILLWLQIVFMVAWYTFRFIQWIGDVYALLSAMYTNFACVPWFLIRWCGIENVLLYSPEGWRLDNFVQVSSFFSSAVRWEDTMCSWVPTLCICASALLPTLSGCRSMALGGFPYRICLVRTVTMSSWYSCHGWLGIS